MTLAWFGCDAGASGDMFLGALVDAGAPIEALQAAIDAIGVERVQLSAEQVERQGVTATKVSVEVTTSDVVRTWGNIRHLLEGAELSDGVRRRALDVFARLAAAEGRAHRTSPEQVHFHEVGALDALADVIGTCAALEALGVTSGAAGVVSLGGGMVRSSHGLLPVPGPAVLGLLTDAQAPVRSGGATYELCTPTGAALLSSVVSRWGDLPPMRVRAWGYGAGERDLDELPNVLRVVIGDPAEELPTTTATLLSANVDDLDPRLWPGVLSALLAAGAADAWLVPILMKKGRPAHTLCVLTSDSALDAARDVVFRQTSTLGLRSQPVDKLELAREERRVTVRGQVIGVKLGRWQGEVVNLQPEYEDVAGAAAALGASTKAVLAEAVAAASQLLADEAAAPDDPEPEPPTAS